MQIYFQKNFLVFLWIKSNLCTQNKAIYLCYEWLTLFIWFFSQSPPLLTEELLLRIWFLIFIIHKALKFYIVLFKTLKFYANLDIVSSPRLFYLNRDQLDIFWMGQCFLWKKFRVFWKVFPLILSIFISHKKMVI